MDIGFDLISDLRLGPEDSFNWENKPTSLYCLVCGNVSSDLRTILQTLAHLSKLYQGVFYIPGTLEYQGFEDITVRTAHIVNVCSSIKNLAVLHHNVVLVDGVAILGANGWGESIDNYSVKKQVEVEAARLEDAAYLHKGIEKLQKHLDVKKILLVTSAVPNKNLFFGQQPLFTESIMPLQAALMSDTEHKVSHWAFGTYDKDVDTNVGNIRYINNSYLNKNPYWAKRITIEF